MTQQKTQVERNKRDSLFLSAVVQIGSSPTFATRVRNLSSGGMMIDAATDLIPGTPLVADMRGIGEVKGRIAWSSPGRAGVAFDEEIDPRLARSGSAGPKSVMPEFLRTDGLTRRPGLGIR